MTLKEIIGFPTALYYILFRFCSSLVENLYQMMNSMATHRYSPYSLPTHTAAASSLQPTSYTSSSLLPSTQGISNNIQVCNISASYFIQTFLNTLPRAAFT